MDDWQRRIEKLEKDFADAKSDILKLRRLAQSNRKKYEGLQGSSIVFLALILILSLGLKIDSSGTNFDLSEELLGNTLVQLFQVPTFGVLIYQVVKYWMTRQQKKDS